jgi:hypothetical protein
LKSLFKIEFKDQNLVLNVVLEEVEMGFISSFVGYFSHFDSEIVIAKLYWQTVNVSLGIVKCGNIAFALDVDGSTEPFTALYDVSQGPFNSQVAAALNVGQHDIYKNLLILNAFSNEGEEVIKHEHLILAIESLETIHMSDGGLTACVSENPIDTGRDFLNLLLENGFDLLRYDGFVDPSIKMVFKPQKGICMPTITGNLVINNSIEYKLTINWSY